jgi:hypothetical protein
VDIARTAAGIVIVILLLIILGFRQQDDIRPFSLGLRGMAASQQREKNEEQADVHGFHRKLGKVCRAASWLCHAIHENEAELRESGE